MPLAGRGNTELSDMQLQEDILCVQRPRKRNRSAPDSQPTEGPLIMVVVVGCIDGRWPSDMASASCEHRAVLAAEQLLLTPTTGQPSDPVVVVTQHRAGRRG